MGLQGSKVCKSFYSHQFHEIIVVFFLIPLVKIILNVYFPNCPFLFCDSNFFIALILSSVKSQKCDSQSPFNQVLRGALFMKQNLRFGLVWTGVYELQATFIINLSCIQFRYLIQDKGVDYEITTLYSCNNYDLNSNIPPFLFWLFQPKLIIR